MWYHVFVAWVALTVGPALGLALEAEWKRLQKTFAK